MSLTTRPHPIDPFAGSTDGRYEDEVVVVARRPGLRPAPGELTGARWSAVTEHFAVGGRRGRLVLLHDLAPEQVDNDVAALLAQELFGPGWAGGADVFERLFTGIVLSGQDDPTAAWELFYRCTLHRLDVLAGRPGPPSGAAGETLAGFAPVYRRAQELVVGAGPGSVLDLGSCFGFFPLRLAADPGCRSVTASDVAPGTCALLARVSVRLGTPLTVLTCDAAGVPLATSGTDTVTVLHVLEHVDADHGEAIVAEAARLARRRVVVAVPLEAVPDPTYGHLRTVTTAQLAATGARLHAAGWRAEVFEHHGGWLVLDRR